MADVDIYGSQTCHTEPYMMAPVLVTDLTRYRAVVDQFPIGEAWSRDRGLVPKLGRAIARFVSLLHRMRRVFVRNMDPRTAAELLTDWERTYAIEVDPDATIEDRRAAILAAVRAQGGNTAEYYQALAIGFGYADAVVEDAGDPLLCDDPCDDEVHDEEWLLSFVVRATSQDAARDRMLMDLIRGHMLAGWGVYFDFT